MEKIYFAMKQGDYNYIFINNTRNYSCWAHNVNGKDKTRPLRSVGYRAYPVLEIPVEGKYNLDYIYSKFVKDRIDINAPIFKYTQEIADFIRDYEEN